MPPDAGPSILESVVTDALAHLQSSPDFAATTIGDLGVLLSTHGIEASDILNCLGNQAENE